MASTFFVQKIPPGKPFVIGRGAGVDFELKDASVSRRHAEIEKRGGDWIFTNLSETSGTLCRGRGVSKKVIDDGDVFFLGLQQLRFSIKDGELFISHVRSVEDVPAIPLSETSSVRLGRGDDDSPGAIQHPACPRFLGTASLEGTRLKLSLARRTFRKTLYLENGETLRLPWCLLEFREGNLFLHQKDSGYSLQVGEVSVELSQKEILQGIRFSLPAGKILSVIGQSGQGKSTLLELLAGKVRRSSGTVQLDGIDYDSKEIRREIAYLPQEPRLRNSLTVMETLRASARVTLPKDYTPAETDRRARKLLNLLHVADLENSRIATLSGGERRRVAIAAELMGAPGIILLDEPLSGLDPLNAKRLSTHLKELAAEGHTIVLTTHSYEALQVSDAVLLIHRGKMGFYGTPEDAFRYFNAETPEGILESLSEKTADNWKESGLGTAAPDSEPPKFLFPEIPRKNVFPHFFTILFKQWFRDRGKVSALILQPLVIGFLLSQIFSRNSSLWIVAFALILSANWFALSLSVREIIQEKDLLLDEFRKGVPPAAVILSKWIFTATFAFLETALVYACIARSVSVPPSAGLFFALFETVVPASAAGLLLSALSKNPGQANAFLPLIILPQIALSGALVPFDSTTPAARILSKCIWTSYNQSALQDVFTGQVPAVSDWICPAAIAILIYIVTVISQELMKRAK